MATKLPWAILKKVNRLLDTPNENGIELALELAALGEAKKGSVSDLGKIRPKQRRPLYGLLAVGR